MVIGDQIGLGTWSSSTSYQHVWEPSSTVTCEGDQCDRLARYLGPDWKWGCGWPAQTQTYSLEPYHKLSQASQALSDFAPTEGIYTHVKDLAGPKPNPNDCKWPSDFFSLNPDEQISLEEPGRYLVTPLPSETPHLIDFPPYRCEFQEKSIRCEMPELRIPFGIIFGFGDATAVFTSQTAVGAWTSPTSYHRVWAPSFVVTCEGAECHVMTDILGPQWEWGCGGAATGEGFVLKP